MQRGGSLLGNLKFTVPKSRGPIAMVHVGGHECFSALLFLGIESTSTGDNETNE